MKILAIEKEIKGADGSNAESTLKAETLHVYNLYLNDTLREIYFNEHNSAVLILECENLQSAEQVLQTLPLVKAGLIKFDVMQLNPYTGFKRLIEQ